MAKRLRLDVPARLYARLARDADRFSVPIEDLALEMLRAGVEVDDEECRPSAPPSPIGREPQVGDTFDVVWRPSMKLSPLEALERHGRADRGCREPLDRGRVPGGDVRPVPGAVEP